MLKEFLDIDESSQIIEPAYIDTLEVLPKEVLDPYLQQSVSDKTAADIKAELLCRDSFFIRATAGELVRKGFKPIPLASRSKIPNKGCKWKDTNFTPHDFTKGQNIGIKTGTPHILKDTIFGKYDTEYYLTVVDIDTADNKLIRAYRHVQVFKSDAQARCD